MNLILLGPPGSGKGTQGVKLAAKLGALHFSTGDMLRQEIASKSELGRSVEAIMGRGELVSDQIVLDVARNRIERHERIVFDGIPRNLSQAVALDALLAQAGRQMPIALLLEVPEEELRTRLLKRAQELGRADDTLETVVRRLEVYRSETSPLIEFFAERGRLKTVDGLGTFDEVEARLLGAVNGI